MTTDTIRLRAMEPEDLELLYGIENDSTIWNSGSTNVPYSRYVLHNYIATSSSDIYADKQLRLIIETADHRPVGIADLVNFDPRHMRAEIGIVIIPAYRRNGYATYALRKLVSYATAILHLHQLYAVVAKGNTPCRSLFAKLQFDETACLPQWLSTGHGYEDAIVFSRILTTAND